MTPLIIKNTVRAVGVALLVVGVVSFGTVLGMSSFDTTFDGLIYQLLSLLF